MKLALLALKYIRKVAGLAIFLGRATLLGTAANPNQRLSPNFLATLGICKLSVDLPV